MSCARHRTGKFCAFIALVSTYLARYLLPHFTPPVAAFAAAEAGRSVTRASKRLTGDLMQILHLELISPFTPLYLPHRLLGSMAYALSTSCAEVVWPEFSRSMRQSECAMHALSQHVSAPSPPPFP
eukprot:6192626-Pleurochrysis_carterae.AAC.2